MFLSVATSNLVATSLAHKVSALEVSLDVFFLLLSSLSTDRCFRFAYNFYILLTGVTMYEDVEVVPEVIVVLQNKEEAAHHLSRMLFLAVACGFGLLVVTEVWVNELLQGI